MAKEQCDVCKGELSLKDTKSLGGTEYQMWQCQKCRKIVARHKE